MSVQVGYALFDSVTGQSFGPAFDSGEDADAFLEWLREHSRVDPRAMNADVLTEWFRTWQRVTGR